METSSKFCLSNYHETLILKYGHYMHLKLFVDVDLKLEPEVLADLYPTYKQRIDKHNSKLITDQFLDAGFDLLVPYNMQIQNYSEDLVRKLNHYVKCSAVLVYGDQNYTHPTGYYMYSRSSSPFRLVNSVGIIDAGYRGNLIALLDNKNFNKYDPELTKHSRIVQLCAPDLCPICVELVDTLEDLGITTERGQGGFGSSG